MLVRLLEKTKLNLHPPIADAITDPRADLVAAPPDTVQELLDLGREFGLGPRDLLDGFRGHASRNRIGHAPRLPSAWRCRCHTPTGGGAPTDRRLGAGTLRVQDDPQVPEAQPAPD